MYINRLIEFTETYPQLLPPLGYKRKRIHWIVDVTVDRLVFTKALKNFELVVPDTTRSSETKPIILIDRADYVFGLSDSEKNSERSKTRHKSYLKLLDEYFEESGDQDVALLKRLLVNDLDLHEDIQMNDLIAFRIRDSDWLHDKRTVQKFWRKPMKQVKSNQELRCMHCGDNGSIMDRHTISFTIGKDRTKLISANANAYESHQLQHSFSAPTCYACEQKYGQALEYLLQRHRDRDKPGGPHMFRLGGLTYVFWLRGDTQFMDGLMGLLSPQSTQTKKEVLELVDQLFTGIPTDRNLNNFCLLTLSANKTRLVVRDYVENSVTYLQERIRVFFEAQDVGAKRFYGIYALAATMYKEPTKQMQKYAIKEWMDWFLHGRPLSGRVLIPLLKQIQVEGEVYSHQAAAVNSWFVSQNGRRQEEMTSELGLDKQSSYLCGRLFALLEKVQKDAIGSKNTISTQYFGSASTAPRSTMGLLVRNAQNHLAKLVKTNTGSAIYYDKKIGQVLERLSEFPQTLNLAQQAEFVLGYYHEKQELYTKREKGEEMI